MCKRTGKVMFGCSFAFQLLAFLCATTIFVKRVVNGNGKGTPLLRFAEVPKSTLKRLEYGELFLDSATGDLYAYDPAKSEFYPVANTSLHHHKTAEENRTLHAATTRSSMLKSIRYVSQNFDTPEQIYVARVNETRCRVMKQHLQHWLAEGIGVRSTQFHDFLVPCSNAWDVHPVNSAEQENIYTVLAESPRAPAVILIKNIVCTQFHINPKYPDTCTLLRNFVSRMTQRIFAEPVRVDLPLSRVFVGGGPRMAAGGSSGKRVATGHHSVAYQVAKHSGFAFSKRAGPVLVMNNATTAAAWKSSVGDSSFDSGVPTKTPPLRSPQHLRKPLSLDNASELSSPVGAAETLFSKANVREFLHPRYHPARQRSEASTPRTAKPIIKCLIPSTPYCRFREFSQPATPTQSPEHSRQRLELPSKEKWVSAQDFQRVFRSKSVKGGEGLATFDPGSPKHVFREVKKESWISGMFRY